MEVSVGKRLLAELLFPWLSRLPRNSSQTYLSEVRDVAVEVLDVQVPDSMMIELSLRGPNNEGGGARRGFGLSDEVGCSMSLDRFPRFLRTVVPLIEDEAVFVLFELATRDER